MKSDTSLVRSDSTVKLYTVTGVNLYLSLIIYPRNTELKLSLGVNDPL